LKSSSWHNLRRDSVRRDRPGSLDHIRKRMAGVVMFGTHSCGFFAVFDDSLFPIAPTCEIGRYQRCPLCFYWRPYLGAQSRNYVRSNNNAAQKSHSYVAEQRDFGLVEAHIHLLYCCVKYRNLSPSSVQLPDGNWPRRCRYAGEVNSPLSTAGYSYCGSRRTRKLYTCFKTVSPRFSTACAAVHRVIGFDITVSNLVSHDGEALNRFCDRGPVMSRSIQDFALSASWKCLAPTPAAARCAQVIVGPFDPYTLTNWALVGRPASANRRVPSAM
jgi:hypothetical protein